MIRFYTDSHIAKTIAVQLRHRNIDVVRCQDVGMDDADDVEHLEYATSQERTVITSDADFLALDAQWQSSGKPHAGIIYVPPERKDAIGTIVAHLVFLHEAVAAGAADLATDVYNRVIRIERIMP
jgi:predicted nuclease of predicted toxin-antitoxin system